MNPNDPARVLDEIAAPHVRPDLNLMPDIQIRIATLSQKTMQTSRKYRLAALLVALALIITLFSVPGVVSALKSWFGYLPGVGTVDQSVPLRVLAERVTAARDGYTLTIDSALLDSTRTVLSYRIAGQFPTWSDPALEPATCQEYAVLRLPDGSELTYPTREYSTGGGSLQMKETFTAVPPGQDSAVLVLPCLAGLPAGEGPQNWEIPLAFAPAPPDLTVFPVIEQPTARPQDPQEAGAENDIHLRLKGVAELDEGHFLQAELTWQADPSLINVRVFPDAIHLTDAAGQDVAVWPAEQFLPPAPAQQQTLPLDLQTAPISNPGEATLVVDYVAITRPADARFTIDMGEDPQPGQVWQVDQDVEVNGYRLRVVSAASVEPEDGQNPWLMLTLSADPEVVAVTAMDTEHELAGTGGSPNSELFPFESGWRYQGEVPSGTIEVQITTLTVRRTGPWSLTWTPSASPADPARSPTRQPGESACLDETGLQAAPAGLPEGLGGRVAFMEETAEGFALFASNLDGRERVSLGAGRFPDLSPDGQQVVHQGPDDGLYLRSLSGGEAVLVPGTLDGDAVEFLPKWSPDGALIAFTRYAGHTSDLYLLDADGANLRPVVDGPEPETFLGWGPDSSRLYYWVSTPDEGMSLRSFDPGSGAAAEIALLPPGTLFPSLSPDGQRLVLMTEPDLLLVDVASGETRTLIAGPHSFGNPTWSPDGRWVALAHWDPFGSGTPQMVLLELDTCQVYRLPEQTANWLLSWVR